MIKIKACCKIPNSDRYYLFQLIKVNNVLMWESIWTADEPHHYQPIWFQYLKEDVLGLPLIKVPRYCIKNKLNIPYKADDLEGELVT